MLGAKWDAQSRVVVLLSLRESMLGASEEGFPSKLSAGREGCLVQRGKQCKEKGCLV